MTTAREAVEAVLIGSRLHPRTAQKIAELSGYSATTVQTVISAAVKANRAHSVGTSIPRLYVWGPTPPERTVCESVSRISSEAYRGEASLPVRPGSMDFLSAPSLVNGQRVERTRPALIMARAAS